MVQVRKLKHTKVRSLGQGQGAWLGAELRQASEHLDSHHFPPHILIPMIGVLWCGGREGCGVVVL